jgi:hypothetical protein
MLKNDAERRASGVPPTRVFSEKRLQAAENKGSRCGITAKERSKRRQSLRNKELGVFGAVRLGGPNGYFMGYYTIWLALVKSFFGPFWEFPQAQFQPCQRTSPLIGFNR